MACEEEWERVRETEGTPAHAEALEEWRACLIKNLAIQAGRDSHASAWDERMYLHYKFLQEAWDEVFGVIKPLPGPDDPRTRQLRTRLAAKPERVLGLSRAVAKALDRAEIKLGRNETFACLLFVIDKPKSVSQLIAARAADAEGNALPRIHAVVEPGVMGQVMEALARDRIE